MPNTTSITAEGRPSPITILDDEAATFAPERGPTSRAPRVSVVIPAINEARNLPYVLTRLPRDLHEVILVDGRSTDNTFEVARTLHPDIRVIHQRGRGKGNALQEGFVACTGDIIVMLDADGSTDPKEISRFVLALCAGADFVKGSRFASGGGSADITRLRRLGNWALNMLVNGLFRTRFTDLCYGYNAFWTYCLPHIDIDCDGFEVETLINIRAAKAGLTVHEVPSYEGHRVHGTSNLNALRDGFRVLGVIVAERRIGRGLQLPRPPAVPRGYGWDGVERRETGRSSSDTGVHGPGRTGRRASDRSVISIAHQSRPRPM